MYGGLGVGFLLGLFTFSRFLDFLFAKAKAAITAICEAHELILKDPAYAVRVSSYGDHGIDIVVRVWTKSADYWTVHFELLDAVKAAFDENGIDMPYNQLDVHIKND